MKYVVKIGVSQEIKFVFDNMGDALDFITTCLSNGYRATVVPEVLYAEPICNSVPERNERSKCSNRSRRERGMSKKYVIEIKPEYEDSFKGLMILGAKDSNLFVDTLAVENIEEINSDYINEHYGDLQDDAYERGHGIGYQKGFKDGKEYGLDESDMREAVSYQRGLDDAWEAAKKIALMDTETSENVTGYFGLFRILENLTPMQALEKLKAYEEKQKAEDDIKVGDEVAFHHDDRPDTVVVVTYIGQDGFIDGMDGRGTQYAHKNPAKWTKTGRHFDIAGILEEMKK